MKQPKINIDDWIEIQQLRRDGLTASEFVLEIAHIFNPEFDDDITHKELRELRKKYAFLLKDLKPTYNVLPIDFKTIKFSTFIDLDLYLTTYPIHEKIKDIAGLLFPDSEPEITDVLGAVNSFVNWRANIIEKYKGIFDYNDDEYEDEEGEDYEEIEEENNPNDKWGWLAVVYNLAAGDITKVDTILDKSFIAVLNWASMRRDFESQKPKPTAQNHH